MKIAEVTNKPPTPEQLRIDSLKATKDRAAAALTAERKRQQVTRAQKSLTAARHTQRPVARPTSTVV